MRFANPLFFFLFFPLLIFLFFHFRRLSHAAIRYANVAALKQIATVKTAYISRLVLALRVLILSLIIIALARPQSVFVEREVSSEGVDIMLALDVSRSMSAEDFKPKNRLTVAKQTMQEFIQKRQSDRIGLVVFSGQAYTQCPLTLDYRILLNLLDQVHFDMAGQGTSVGMAIATALNRLKLSDAQSKVLVLLTDGVNNSGKIDPMTAAQLAKELGVRVYTIGVGKEQNPLLFNPFLGQVAFPEVDEATLKSIAKLTNGAYFRAHDAATLRTIYDKIDRLERSEIKTNMFYQYHDHFPFLLGLIVILLLVELIFSTLFLVKIP